MSLRDLRRGLNMVKMVFLRILSIWFQLTFFYSFSRTSISMTSTIRTFFTRVCDIIKRFPFFIGNHVLEDQWEVSLWCIHNISLPPATSDICHVCSYLEIIRVPYCNRSSRNKFLQLFNKSPTPRVKSKSSVLFLPEFWSYLFCIHNLILVSHYIEFLADLIEDISFLIKTKFSHDSCSIVLSRSEDGIFREKTYLVETVIVFQCLILISGNSVEVP